MSVYKLYIVIVKNYFFSYFQVRVWVGSSFFYIRGPNTGTDPKNSGTNLPKYMYTHSPVTSINI